MALNIKDVLLGALMAFIGAGLAAVYQLIDNGQLPTTWVELKPVLLASLAAFISYLIKNFFTNSEGKFLKKENG